MKRTQAALLALIAVVLPSAAEAHLVATGMGPIYDGISHFGLSPEDFLPVIALAFYAGLRGARDARLGLAAITAAWLVGGAVALAGASFPAVLLPALTAVLFLSIGGLLAANPGFPSVVAPLLATVLGVVRGLADLAGVEASPAHVLTLVGMAAAVFVVFALAASVTLPLERLWMIVAARVSGSWLAATGLLLAGWIMRYGAKVQ